MSDLQTNCKHTESVEGHWEAREGFNREEFIAGGFEYDEHEWIDGYEKPTVVDVDLHHYKCTQCGKVMRY